MAGANCLGWHETDGASEFPLVEASLNPADLIRQLVALEFSSLMLIAFSPEDDTVNSEAWPVRRVGAGAARHTPERFRSTIHDCGDK